MPGDGAGRRIIHQVCVCVLHSLSTVLANRRHPAHPVSVPILPPTVERYKLCGHKTTTQQEHYIASLYKGVDNAMPCLRAGDTTGTTRVIRW